MVAPGPENQRPNGFVSVGAGWPHDFLRMAGHVRSHAMDSFISNFPHESHATFRALEEIIDFEQEIP